MNRIQDSYVHNNVRTGKLRYVGSNGRNAMEAFLEILKPHSQKWRIPEKQRHPTMRSKFCQIERKIPKEIQKKFWKLKNMGDDCSHITLPGISPEKKVVVVHYVFSVAKFILDLMKQQHGSSTTRSDLALREELKIAKLKIIDLESKIKALEKSNYNLQQTQTHL